jgi:hypothetical protein
MLVHSSNQKYERMIELQIEHAGVLEKVNKVLGVDCKSLSFLETIEALVDHIKKADKDFLPTAEGIAEDKAIKAKLKKEIVYQYERKHIYVDRCLKLEKKLKQASIRIKDLENHIETIARHNFETGLVKAGYMDIDD